MNHTQRVSLFLLRVGAGWLFFYAGITKIIAGNFSAAGYLSGAKLLTGFYSALAAPSAVHVVSLVNEWGLTLLGASLILGALVRWSAPLGILLMILYWIPLGILHPDANSYIVDEHIILSLSLFVLWAFRAGKVWGIDGMRGKGNY